MKAALEFSGEGTDKLSGMHSVLHIALKLTTLHMTNRHAHLIIR